MIKDHRTQLVIGIGVIIVLLVGLVLVIFRELEQGIPPISEQFLCTSDADCILPNEFAIQSNCPFQAICLEGSCAVVCPFISNDPVDYPKTCKDSEDCDCSSRGEKTLACICHKESCLSVESLIE